MFSAVLAVATVVSLAACGTANNSGNATTKDGKTIIKIQTFNNFGYGKPTNERPSADLWSKYEKLHPNIKIEETIASGSDEARSAFNTAISSGSDAYDIYAADIPGCHQCLRSLIPSWI